MCELITILAVSGVGLGLAAKLGGGIMGMNADKDRAKAQQQAYDYQAGIQENNAKIADMQSTQAGEAAEVEKEKLKDRVSLIRGQGRTGYAAGNVMLGSGSPIDWEGDLAGEEAQDLNTIDYNTSLKQWGFQNQAAGFRQQANLYKSAGQQVKRAGRSSMMGSILGMAGTTASTIGGSGMDFMKMGG